ncbi:hypothetical protein [Deferribacter abyssi]|uniref:hypothetical protein n=1 Tax=Deferribacter abyssi TaxID=213806 RepID=UPI003C1AF8F0
MEKDDFLIEKIIYLDLKHNINILLQEIKTTFLNYTFFTLEHCSKDENDINNRESIRYAFSTLRKLAIRISKNTENLIKIFNELPKQLENLEIFYNNLLEINVLSNIISTQLSFLQRKINYILDCYPIYFPTVTLYRTKQELKSYEWLKGLVVSFMNYLHFNIFNKAKILETKIQTYTNNTDIKDHKNKLNFTDVIFNWSSNNINMFIEKSILESDKNDLLLIDSSYFIINRHSLWINMLHEALHYLINLEYRNVDFESSNEFVKKYFDIKKDLLIKLEYTIIKQNLSIDIKAIAQVYDDIFIDSYLTKIFGMEYYLPLFNSLIFSQFKLDSDINLYEPRNDLIWLRLIISLEFIKDKSFLEIKDKLKYFLLHKYKETIIKNSPQKSKEFLFTDIKIYRIITKSMELLFKNLNEKIGFNNYLKASNSKNSDNNNSTNNYPLNILHNYLIAQRFLIHEIIEKAKKFNFEQLLDNEQFNRFSFKEGRITTNFLNLLDFVDFTDIDYNELIRNIDENARNITKSESKNSIISFLQETTKFRLLKISFLKMRFDNDSFSYSNIYNFIEKDNVYKNFTFLNFGAYNLVNYELLGNLKDKNFEDHHDNYFNKVFHKINNIISICNERGNSNQTNNSEQNSNQQRNIFYYKYEIVGHIIYHFNYNLFNTINESNIKKFYKKLLSDILSENNNYNDIDNQLIGFFDKNDIIINIELTLDKEYKEIYKELLSPNFKSKFYYNLFHTIITVGGKETNLTHEVIKLLIKKDEIDSYDCNSVKEYLIGYFANFEFLVIQTSTWADFIILLGFKLNNDGKLYELLENLKNNLHYNLLFKKTVTNVTIKNIKDKNKIELPVPQIFLRYSSKIPTYCKNNALETIIKTLTETNAYTNWNLYKSFGIYDLTLIPTNKNDKIDYNTLTNILEKLAKVKISKEEKNNKSDIKCDKKLPVLTDIQMRLFTKG